MTVSLSSEIDSDSSYELHAAIAYTLMNGGKIFGRLALHESPILDDSIRSVVPQEYRGQRRAGP